MTEQPENPEHGQPGHVCHAAVLDATDVIAGVFVRPHPDVPDALEVEAWSHGVSKRTASKILRSLSDQWAADADLEESRQADVVDMVDNMRDIIAEEAERSRTAGLN